MLKPKSVTHQHLAAIINSELHRFRGKKLLRILDAGCGDGAVIIYFYKFSWVCS